MGDVRGGAVRQRHRRDHRIGAAGGRHAAGVADVDPRGVVQFARRVGHRGLRICAQPATAHLVCREQLQPTGPQRHALYRRDERLQVLAAAPALGERPKRDDLLGAAGVVQPDLLLDGGAGDQQVDLIGHRVVDHRVPLVVDGHRAVPAVAGECNRKRRVAELGDGFLVLSAGGPGHSRDDDRRRPLPVLDQEAVTIFDVGELVHHGGHRCTPPRRGLLRVDAEETHRRMQVQVLADRRAADAGAQQQRGGLQRAARDDHAWSLDGQLPRRSGRRVGVRGFHAGGAAVLHQHPLRRTADDHRAAGLDCIAQIGLANVALGAGPVTESDVPGGFRRIGLRVGIAVQHRERPAQGVRAGAHPQVRTVEVRAVAVDAEALPDRVDVRVVVRRRDVLEPEFLGPVVAHPFRRTQTVGPVDRRAAAQRGGGEHADIHVCGGVDPAAPEQLLVGEHLVAHEVGLVARLAGFEHDDIEPGLGQDTGDQTTARAGAHDADVGRARGLGGREGRQRLRSAGRYPRQPFVAERRPGRIDTGARVRDGICHGGGQRGQRLHPGSRGSAHQCDVADHLLAGTLRAGGESEHVHTVEQAEQTIALLLGQTGDHLGDSHIGAQAASAGRPEPGRVVVARHRRNDGVSQGA